MSNSEQGISEMCELQEKNVKNKCHTIYEKKKNESDLLC
jgi:hypothetical protein